MNRTETTQPGGPSRVQALVAEMARFLSVGGVAFVVDLGLFNLLRFGPGEVLEHKPITARVIAVAAATLVSWLGNRHWTFAQHRTHRRGRELTLYAMINLAGIAIQVGTLAFSHYVLDLRTPLADNLSTLVGIGIGTIVRYVGYKTLVFTARGHTATEGEATTLPSTCEPSGPTHEAAPTA